MSYLEGLPGKSEVRSIGDNMKLVGLIVNPIAGMGGTVGLKGTDGVEILDMARKLGAKPEAPSKAILALKKLLPVKDKIRILTASGDMGENQCKEAGLSHDVVYSLGIESSSNDTLLAARTIMDRNVDILMFAGGDGTARDIYTAVGNKLVTVGIPAGVKIHSPVYGNSPEQAGELSRMYITDANVEIMEVEVLDIDEEAYREDRVTTRLYGYLMVPHNRKFLQNKKAPTPLGEAEGQMAIALDIVDSMEDDTYYVIGPGTTTRAVMRTLGLESSLLGVDIVRDKKLVALDCNEKEIIKTIDGKNSKLIITPTGGQGYLLGRGNQQISKEVIRLIKKENIIIIANQSKIIALRGNPLLVYTGDHEVDSYLTGYYKVKIGYGTDLMCKVEGLG